MTLQKFAGTVYQQKVRLIGAGAMGVAAIWTLLCLARPVIDGVKESIAGARADSAERGLHRMDIDMTMKSVGLVFAVTVIGLLVIFYAFVSPEQIPGGQKIAFTLVGVSVAVLMGFFVAAACAYMAGLVGTSSSPISGIARHVRAVLHVRHLRAAGRREIRDGDRYLYHVDHPRDCLHLE